MSDNKVISFHIWEAGPLQVWRREFDSGKEQWTQWAFLMAGDMVVVEEEVAKLVTDGKLPGRTIPQ